MLGCCASGNGRSCGRRSATRWENDQILQRPEAISRPGTSDGGTTRTRTTDHFRLPLADSTHVVHAHPCTFLPTIARVDATHRLALSSGVPFRPAFKHLQPSSPSVSLTPAGRLPFSYTRYPTFSTIAHFLLLSQSFFRPGPDRQRRSTRASTRIRSSVVLGSLVTSHLHCGPVSTRESYGSSCVRYALSPARKATAAELWALSGRCSRKRSLDSVCMLFDLFLEVPSF
jgi:hypothetical protein